MFHSGSSKNKVLKYGYGTPRPGTGTLQGVKGALKKALQGFKGALDAVLKGTPKGALRG